MSVRWSRPEPPALPACARSKSAASRGDSEIQCRQGGVSARRLAEFSNFNTGRAVSPRPPPCKSNGPTLNEAGSESPPYPSFKVPFHFASVLGHQGQGPDSPLELQTSAPVGRRLRTPPRGESNGPRLKEAGSESPPYPSFRMIPRLRPRFELQGAVAPPS